MANVKVNGAGTTKRVVFVAGPGTEILDLVGPLQVFARASDMHGRANPDPDPIDSAEVVSLGPPLALIANCGLHFSSDKTVREARGSSDTVLCADGDAMEQE